jgi:hypothetical protein
MNGEYKIVLVKDMRNNGKGGMRTKRGKHKKRKQNLKGVKMSYYWWKTIQEINEGDLIETDGEIYKTRALTNEYIGENFSNCGEITQYDVGRLYYKYTISDDGYYKEIEFVDETDITAIYRKQENDYICIWKRSEATHERRI